jgi:hypothetical protein
MIDNISGPVLQMFGTRCDQVCQSFSLCLTCVIRYVVEPFFFSSSLNWIPSRYAGMLLLSSQIPSSDQHARERASKARRSYAISTFYGSSVTEICLDITICLTFLRPMDNTDVTDGGSSTHSRVGTSESLMSWLPSWSFFANQRGENETIDTRAPLSLRSGELNIFRSAHISFKKSLENKILLLDLLAIHMIRSTEGSTIITYHPDRDWNATSAQELHTRLKLVGRSVYWQNIFRNSVDPTFVFLALLWHALYAWDEALETLYEHFCWLVSKHLASA